MEMSPCSSCQSPTSAFLCYCEKKYFCKGCLSFHLLNNPFVRHNPVPLEGQEKAMRYISESDDLQLDEPSIGSGTTRSEKARTREILERELLRLNNFRISAMEQLQQVRNQWIDEITRATEEIEVILTEKCDMMAREIEQCMCELDDFIPSPSVTHALKDLTHRSDSMLDLSFDLRPIDLNTLIKQFVNFSLNYSNPPLDNCYLYKFFGSQGYVSCFDMRSERVTNTYHSVERFLHNSSWVLTPAGEIYITGGSLMGKSKDDVLLFVPEHERTEIISPMSTPRRSHTTVFLNETLYVFGGIYEEQKIALAESMNVGSRLWARVSEMTCPRAYLGCAVFQGQVYLAGGADISSLDIFHPETQTYDYISFEGIALTEACSLLPLDDTTLLVFHGNYQGEVFEYKPETQEMNRVCEMCHGNSWSNCAPLRYKDAIYTIRSDSVFKFDMITYTSSYVIRMAKSTKKRKIGEDPSPL